MSSRLTQLAVGLLAVAVCLAPASSLATTVFAAASLKDAFEEVATEFTAATGAELTLSFASSAILARQIDFGAPADLFISANGAWMDWLSARGRIKATTRMNLIGNRLVLVSHRAGVSQINLSDSSAIAALLGNGRLAMGLVTAVPAGIYGKAALSNLGMWSTLKDRVAQTDNVRSAVTLVATGQAPLGIVYASDALISNNVHVVTTFPSASHEPIVYPLAELQASRDPVVRQLTSFLNTQGAQAVFIRHGFTPLPRRIASHRSRKK